MKLTEIIKKEYTLLSKAFFDNKKTILQLLSAYFQALTKMSLLNKYLPVFQFSEVHETIVDANREQSYCETLHLDLAQSKVISLLFRMGGIPFRNTRLVDLTRDLKFTLLEEDRFSEFLYACGILKCSKNSQIKVTGL